MEDITVGHEIYSLAERLWPIPRSLTGNGVRETLRVLKEIVPQLDIHEVKSGTKCFDWEVPLEWNINDAYIETPSGELICQFRHNNLHVLGYSSPVDKVVDLKELEDHLFSIPELPDAIPYVTSYYKKNWGFCISENERNKLQPGNYRVYIDSKLHDGYLTYGEIFIEGETDEEVLLSTYICHPSMANNELSGPCVSIFLAKWLLSKSSLKKSYRIVFIPETIGSIFYLSQNYTMLKQKVVAGFIVNCVGDDRCYSFLPSRSGKSISDRVGEAVLKEIDPDYKRYSFLERGSDERQYCYPGIDLPIASLMRSKYAEYPEYHTSMDDLNFISSNGLEGSFKLFQRCLQIIDSNRILTNTNLCEPQLGKRGLYPNTSTPGVSVSALDIVNLLTYCDGKHDLFEISQITQLKYEDVIEMAQSLESHGLLNTIER